MNTPKIATLYAQVAPAGQLCLPLVHLALKATSRQPGPDGYAYHFNAACLAEHHTYRDEFGERCSGFVDAYCPKRVADWLRQQMPGYPTDILNVNKSLPDAEQHLVSVWGYGRAHELPTQATLRYGALSDFTAIVRGMVAYQRKVAKHQRKTLAQLRAYHQQQVSAKLRRGQWLGAAQALTTTARVDEPCVPFLGDLNLTPEQLRQLRTWAVPEQAGMSAAFPTGTGLALKVITSSKQLVDGAVYLSQVTFGKPSEAHYAHVMRLGRLDLSRKTYGMIPLFQDDAPAKNLHIQAEWKRPTEGQGYEVLLLQVVGYTTRNAASQQPRHEEPCLALPLEAQHQPDQHLELALAA